MKKWFSKLVLFTVLLLIAVYGSGLAAAAYELPEAQAQYLSAKGMTQLVRTVNKTRLGANPNLKIDGVLFTLADMRLRMARATADTVRQSYGKAITIFKSVIPVATKGAEASAEAKSIYAYDKNSEVAKAYAAFTKEVMQLGERNKAKSSPCR